jgi:hypothetical protein
MSYNEKTIMVNKIFLKNIQKYRPKYSYDYINITDEYTRDIFVREPPG